MSDERVLLAVIQSQNKEINKPPFRQDMDYCYPINYECISHSRKPLFVFGTLHLHFPGINAMFAIVI